MTSTPARPRAVGFGRVLVVIYGLLALAATGRSFYQIASDFDRAPVSYLLSAVAAVVYILATVALVGRGSAWYRVALATIGFELAGVLVVGTLSLADPHLFEDQGKAVWSFFGAGYAFVPLVLPVAGLVWLYLRRPRAVSA